MVLFCVTNKISLHDSTIVFHKLLVFSFFILSISDLILFCNNFVSFFLKKEKFFHYSELKKTIFLITSFIDFSVYYSISNF